MPTSRLLKLESRVDFKAVDWVNNIIVVLREGVPAVLGEIGPHDIPEDFIYETSVYRTDEAFIREIDLSIQQNPTTGSVTLIKAAASPDFSGTVLLEAR